MAISNDVKIKPSRIPQAGNGLFSNRRFQKGELVCEYTGKVLTLLQAIRTPDKTYMMGGFGLNVHLDAQECPESMGRYINDPRNPELLNVEFVKLRDARKALVVATRDIEVDEELYVSYGEGYWRVHEGVEMRK